MAPESLSQYLEPVDRFRVLVLVDDYSGMDSKPLAQHGISHLVEVEKLGRRTRMLLDTDSNGEVKSYSLSGPQSLGVRGTALRASELFGVNEIYAVMGGFHPH